MIPFFDLKAQYMALKEDLSRAVKGVFESGFFILGPKLEEFEASFAGYLGAKYCSGVGSGTDAITIALQAAGVGPGDEVITVPNTAIPTVAAIRDAGAVPVFVDIDPATYTIDPSRLEDCVKERAIEGRVRAVVPVHLYGQAADMDAVMDIAGRYDLRVIEDACQAHGAEHRGVKAGTIGDLGCFSFYPTKNLGAYGDGGAVVANDSGLNEKVRLLRNYGQRDRYHAIIEGVNSRLDEIQAAVLSVKLKCLDGWNEKRRELAAVYNASLDDAKVTKPIEADWARHVYHLYVIRHKSREGLKDYLQRKGISTLIHYPVPVHLQDAYSYLKLPSGTFPAAETAAAEILSLPIFPELEPSMAQEVASAINGFSG